MRRRKTKTLARNGAELLIILTGYRFAELELGFHLEGSNMQGGLRSRRLCIG